ncbi:MAG: NUDIX domain-containing protein [candidate division KSB1 bacterium]|nr:NUDIX domain-containing protein [candidate division KSB1 bacterium]
MHSEIHYYPLTQVLSLTYVLILSRQGEKWLFVRQKDRGTWEIPAGHVEPGETAEEAARRELYEETGTVSALLTPVTRYGVRSAGRELYGQLFFAEIKKRQPRPDSEIDAVILTDRLPSLLTFPDIQYELIRTILEHMKLPLHLLNSNTS